jgi:hypothetical protein
MLPQVNALNTPNDIHSFIDSNLFTKYTYQYVLDLVGR